jgi:hypothetical protein
MWGPSARQERIFLLDPPAEGGEAAVDVDTVLRASLRFSEVDDAEGDGEGEGDDGSWGRGGSGLADAARHIIQRIFNPRFLN